MRVQLNITTAEEVTQRLREYCAKNGHTISGLVTRIIREHLDREEDTDGKETA